MKNDRTIRFRKRGQYGQDTLTTEKYFQEIMSTSKTIIARTSVKFSFEDKDGNKETYHGLLDTGSIGSLMSEELVEKFRLETKKSNSTWDTNNGEFKIRRTAITNNLRFPEFTNKRKVDRSKFYVNKNVKQKYKIIFGLEFLIENKFDFLLSTRIIKWQGIQIAINGNTLPRENNEYQNNGKQVDNNAYRKHTRDSVANYKNTDHLSGDERKSLPNLISQFEGILQGTVGDYKEMEINFDIDKDKTLYHAKPYRILVTHMPLIKKAISEIVNKGVNNIRR